MAARAADPGPAPIAVVLHSESEALSFDTLVQALNEELKTPTVLADSQASSRARGVLTVTYHRQTKELVVSYSDAVRGTVTRVVPAPEQESGIAELVALVAGNLVRDQASEFLPVVPAPVAPVPQPTVTPSTSEISPSEPTTKPPVHRLGNAAFFYPLATNMNESELETNFDFSLLYGHIGGLDGLQLGTVSTVTNNASGLQISALTNLVGGDVRAAQISALYNRGRNVDGVQLALVNRADEAMQGLQLGALNMSSSLSQGVQVSATNIASNFEGVQIGVVNVGKRVRGVQLGLVNVADDVDGLPIGLLSVTKSGGVHPVAWSSNTTYGNLGVKFATRYTYTMIGGAMHYDGAHNLYGAGFTIGGSIPVQRRIFVDVDVQALHLLSDTACIQQQPQQGGFGNGWPAQQQATPNGACIEGSTSDPNGMSLGYTIPKSENFTSANSRAYDQSLAKLRGMLRFDVLSHLSLFVGTGVTGRVTYPVVNGDTEVKFKLLGEVFGGVQL